MTHHLSTTKDPSRFRAWLLVLAAGGSLMAAAPTVRAQTTVISDSFSGISTSLLLHTPDTDRVNPTATYGTNGTGAVIPSTNGGGLGQTGANYASYLSIANVAGGFTKPAVLTLSMSIEMGTLTETTGSGTASASRGIGLGFFSAAGTAGSGNTNFYGLAVEPGTGALTLEVNGVRSGNAVALPGGTYSSGTLYNLSYTINTNTGIISGVVYNGTDVTSSFTNLSTTLAAATTNLVGFYGSSDSTGLNITGDVDNFSVINPVPEPSTWLVGALLCGTSLVSLRLLWRDARRSEANDPRPDVVWVTPCPDPAACGSADGAGPRPPRG